MVFTRITGFAVNATRTLAGNSSMIPGGENSAQAGFWAIMAFLGPLMLIIGAIISISLLVITANLVLFLISIAKKKIGLDEVLRSAMSDFKENYGKFFRYYILIIILFLLQIGSVFYYDSQGFTVRGTESLFSQEYLILLAGIGLNILILTLYGLLVDTSLAKSYFNKLKGENFSFRWITSAQFLKLVLIHFVYLVIIMPLGLLLAGIPNIIMFYTLPFVRYPIITENKGIIESIKRSLSILKNEFWDVIFHVTIYGVFVSALNSLFGGLPIIGDFVVIFTFVVISPFTTMYFTKIYYKIENKNLSDQLGKKDPGISQDPVAAYIRRMESQGYSDDQIRLTLQKAGYDQKKIDDYFSKKNNQVHKEVK